MINLLFLCLEDGPQKFIKNTKNTRNAQIIYERNSEKQNAQFKSKLHEFDWAEILALENTDRACDNFLKIFPTYCNESVPKVEVKLKKKLSFLFVLQKNYLNHPISKIEL